MTTIEEAATADPSGAVAGPAELRFGAGSAIIDPASGAPIQFRHATQPQRRFLLDGSVQWHGVEHQWGSGHLITPEGGWRWNAPTKVTLGPDATSSHFAIGSQLKLEIRREAETDSLVERFEWCNLSPAPVTITGLGIQTPFADLYVDANHAIEQAVHAHVFTGGTWAWVLAQPMSGQGPSLGLIVEEGALWGYSVESRNQYTMSNARGHLVLNVTDHARNPQAMGGQPTLTLAPGEALALQWRLAWFTSTEDFLEATRAPARLSALSAAVGSPIRVDSTEPVRVDGAVVTPAADRSTVTVTAEVPGNYTVRIGDHARTEIAFHDPLEATVRRRVDYILRHQRASHRPGSLGNALLPVDTTTRLAQQTNGWSDWTDGSERIGLALLLQRALRRGWAPAEESTAALAGWESFALDYLLDDTAAPRRGSHDQHTGARLYDSIWLAEFFLDRYLTSSNPEHLALAEKILLRAFQLGAHNFLAIHLSQTCVDVADALESAGQADRAVRLREKLVESADHFVRQGRNLPGHEVAYEQSIVAPLISLLSDAYRITGDNTYLDAARQRLPWLLAFGGPQPHARLGGIAIRHWDGFWFGLRRQWGDIFPHYWSALTAEALLGLPSELRSEDFDQLAGTILSANMSNYFPDGGATCAFVFPTSIDGVPANAPDPLANDQDWHLAIWLRLLELGTVNTALTRR